MGAWGQAERFDLGWLKTCKDSSSVVRISLCGAQSFGVEGVDRIWGGCYVGAD